MAETDTYALPVGYVLTGRGDTYTLVDRGDGSTVLGQGGFGITYLALSKKFAQQVAVKELYVSTDNICRRTHASLIAIDKPKAFEALKQAFLKEAKTLAMFRAEHRIVDVLDIFEANNTRYLVMPYLQGKDFSELAKLETFDEARVRDLIVQLATGLKKVHDKGLLHRDIKPDNIKLSEDGTYPILIDFGSSREVESTGSLYRAFTDGFSPWELYILSLKKTPATDVYSLAATAYFLLLGETPPPAAQRFDDWEAHNEDPENVPAPMLAPLNRAMASGKVSSQFGRALETALALHARNRFQSLDAFVAAITKGSTAPVPPLRRRRRVVAGLAVGLGLLVGAYAWYQYPGPHQVSSEAAELEVVEAIPRVSEEEAARLAEEEAARLSAEEAARLSAEEAARLSAEEAARLAEEEAARLAAEEAARLAEEEAARLAAEEAARLAAEEAARLAAEEAARLAAEESARLAAEEAARLAAEEAARLAAEEAARLAAEESAWQVAVQEDSRDSYQDYLDNYPDGKWAQEARLRLDEVEQRGELKALILACDSSTMHEAAENDNPNQVKYVSRDQVDLTQSIYSCQAVQNIQPNHFRSKFLLARAYATQGNYQQAVPILMELEELEYLPAQTYLGAFYDSIFAEIDGFDIDYERARMFFELGCEDQISWSCGRLGELYEDGDLGEPDYLVASQYYELGCEGGNGWSCGQLGGLYQDGELGAPDYLVASQYYELGCEGGNGWSCGQLGGLYQDGELGAPDYLVASQYFELGCEGGDAWSCSSLGFLYEKGRLGEPDYSLAGEYYKIGCEGGHARACGLFAELYEDGDLGEPDYLVASQYYELGCEEGDGWSCGQLGDLYQDGDLGEPDYLVASQYFELGCEGGHAWSCSSLGFLYEKGRLGEPDYSLAGEYYKIGCEGGHARACGLFADLHEDGDLGEPDYLVASQYYELGCEEGDGWSCGQLGDLYQDGDLGEPDYLVASQYFELGCEGGDAWSCGRLGALYDDGVLGEPDYVVASQYFELGCEGDSAWSCGRLGALYDDGNLGEPDYLVASQYFELGCEGGNGWSCGRLGELYQDGDLGEPDYLVASQYFELGCEEGNAWSCGRLGALYDDGDLGEPDYLVASQYFELGCEEGNAWSCGRLGALYDDGDLGEPDYLVASQYFELGCEGDNAWSCGRLGELYQDGDLGEPDYLVASQYFELGCEGDNAWSCGRLGDLYVYGDLGEPDYLVASQYFELGCEGGNAWSCGRLGDLYVYGDLGEPDYLVAGQYYELGCEGGNAWSCSQLRELIADVLGDLLSDLYADGSLSQSDSSYPTQINVDEVAPPCATGYLTQDGTCLAGYGFAARHLQATISFFGCKIGGIDGSFGPKSVASVRHLLGIEMPTYAAGLTPERFVQIEAGLRGLGAVENCACKGNTTYLPDQGICDNVIARFERENLPAMVAIPSGRFLMGSPEGEPLRYDDEGPQRLIELEGFYLSSTEITFGMWDACVRDEGCSHNPSDWGWGRGDRPVMNVSWKDAQEFVAWVNANTDGGYSLPSEAQWEYAARAGTTTAFSTGDQITTDKANFNGNYTYNGSSVGIYRTQTVPVGSFEPNAWGLYDMHGNVREWTQDCWNKDLSNHPSNGAALESGDCGQRVLRGGSWGNTPEDLRSAYRSRGTSTARNIDLGFRLLKTL